MISVALRYPWKPKHTGFIIVHASLISLIIIGFYTMETKVEARVILEEGESSSIAILDDRWVELLDPPVRVSGRPPRHVLAGTKPIEFEDIDGLGDIEIDVIDQWANSEEVTRVTNDGSNPFHAIEIAGGAGPGRPRPETGSGRSSPRMPRSRATPPASPSAWSRPARHGRPHRAGTAGAG